MRISFKIILLFAILVLVTSSVSGSVSELKISPENPVVGDKITIKGTASPNEVLRPSITFMETVKVAKGNKNYEYQINGIEIPNGKNNFVVNAKNVKDLNVGVKLLIWWTLSKDASNTGEASIAQGNVPSGNYHIKIHGTAAEDVSSVPLTITASSEIKANEKGNFEYEYSTSNLPPGTYVLNVEETIKKITLYAKNEKLEKREEPEKPEKPEKTDKPEITKKPETTPEIRETPIIIPDDTPGHKDVETRDEETFLRRIMNMFKFW